MNATLIAPALDAYLVATAEPREPDGWYHPSSLFLCDRKAVYEVRGTAPTDEREARDYRPLAMGKALHELVQASVTHLEETDAIRRAWHEVKVEIPDLAVRGSADSLILRYLPSWDEDDPRWADWTPYEIEEFKSIKDSAVKFAKGGFQPKPEHVAQALSYVYALRKYPYRTEDESGLEVIRLPLGDKLRSARIVYLTKDSFDIKEFLFDITPEWEAHFERYMERMNRYRVDPDGYLPPRMASDGKGKPWLCNYCPWRTRCWEVDDEGVEL